MIIFQDRKIARALARPQGRNTWMCYDDTIHDSKIARALARPQGRNTWMCYDDTIQDRKIARANARTLCDAPGGAA